MGKIFKKCDWSKKYYNAEITLIYNKVRDCTDSCNILIIISPVHKSFRIIKFFTLSLLLIKGYKCPNKTVTQEACPVGEYQDGRGMESCKSVSRIHG